MNFVARLEFFLFFGLLIKYHPVIECSTKEKWNSYTRPKINPEEIVNSNTGANANGESNNAVNAAKDLPPSDKREGLRQIIVQMPARVKKEDGNGSDQSSSSEDYPGKKDDPHVRYVGAFDMTSDRIHVMQPIDNGDPHLARHPFFSGGPVTLEDLRKTKEEYRLANQSKNPYNLFEQSSEDDDNDYSDAAEDEIDAVIKRFNRYRGNSLGNERERMRAKRYNDFEKNWTKLRERDLQNEIVIAEVMRERELEYLLQFRPNYGQETQAKEKTCSLKKCKAKKSSPSIEDGNVERYQKIKVSETSTDL